VLRRLRRAAEPAGQGCHSGSRVRKSRRARGGSPIGAWRRGKIQ
jgi:hypothetical protein